MKGFELLFILYLFESVTLNFFNSCVSIFLNIWFQLEEL